MASYNYNIASTSDKQKLLDQANSFAGSDADILSQLRMLQSQGAQGLQKSFGAAQQRIGQQFTPAFRMAQARLGGAPLLADSGYANRLNRQLQTAAFGDLSNAYSQAAADQAGREQGYLSQLINQRLAAKNAYLMQSLGAAEKKNKKSPWSTIGGIAGAGAGALIGGPAGAGVGYSMGSQF